MNRHEIRMCAACALLAAWAWVAGPAPVQAQRGFSGQRGVTLYTDGDFRGASEVFVGDMYDLRRSRVGSDAASSVRISPDCRAILYSDAGFRGRTMEVTYDLPSLSGTPVGNDAVSSLRVDCPPEKEPVEESMVRPQPNRAGPDYSGVTLFWRDDFHGRSQFFYEDQPDLRATAFGHDQASSILVDPRCWVTLYAAIDYGGRSVTLTESERDLNATPVGDDSVSSLRVSCR